jgi:hypothetical protein
VNRISRDIIYIYYVYICYIPSGNSSQFAIEHGPFGSIWFVDLSIKCGGFFHSYVEGIRYTVFSETMTDKCI